MATATKEIAIEAPNVAKVVFKIIGTAPYVQHRMGVKITEQLMERQKAGSTAKKGKIREGKDFDACYMNALYRGPDETYGIPATAFRCAMVSACRLTGFAMTRAKLSIFVDAYAFDIDDNVTPLVQITKGSPEKLVAPVRNATGVVDIRARPMWRTGWEAIVPVSYDADQFTPRDVTNLMMRVGLQVGIGEGRPDSKESCGQGWGLFRLAGRDE